MIQDEFAGLDNAPENAKLLFNRQQIETAIGAIAAELTRDYKTLNPLLLGVMTGAIPFMAQLMLRLPIPLQVDYIHYTRYRNQTRGGDGEWVAKPRIALSDRHIILVDDILDEGHTLSEILTWCQQQGAASVEVAILVDKPNQRRIDSASAKYRGLTAPDKYVFGFGMDYQSYGRNLPEIYALD